MDFWHVFWILVEAIIFLAYLVVLVQIVADLVRDRSLSGWWKALWIAFLIMVPIVTSLVYLIARGQSMAHRHPGNWFAGGTGQARSVEMLSPVDQIAKAKELLDSGAINSSEYENLKARALG